MKRITPSWVAVAAVVVVVTGCSKSETAKNDGTRVPTSSEQPAGRPAAVGTGGAGADVKDDGEFVHDVALKNMAEIELSRLALEKATSVEIKSFARQIIDDQTTSGNALKSVVSGQHIEWPSQLDDKQRKTAEDLGKKQGAEFDREYAKAIVEGDQNLAAKLEARLDLQSVAEWKTAAAGRAQTKALPDPKAEMTDVKLRPNKADSEMAMKINQWAADTYPVVQKHLDTARTLETAAKKRSTN